MHFSPRPNRAHEIRWQPWHEAAFEQARAQDKPILLAISAVWCHWCHVMDETSYSDSAVIEAINASYVPVRVDNDRRPDINARYNQGGWPTTAFLTPDGSLLAGATYLPPQQMLGALGQISTFYRSNREQIAQRAAQIRSEPHPQTAAAIDLREDLIEGALASVEAQFDEEYGGFGNEPKFPMTDVLELLLQEYRISGNQRLYDMLARSMLAMSEGGMYDHVEGGFFRYSTTRDWSVPHFEKMSEDHAALLRLLAVLARETRNPRFRETLVSACGYVRAVLLDERAQFFAGSQDADETYFALPADERKQMQAPYVDRTAYSNWNAGLAGAFLASGATLEDQSLSAQGMATLDALHERMRDSDGLLFHYIEHADGSDTPTPQVRGLLTDQSAYLRALLDAHEYTGEPRFFERARELFTALQKAFAAPDGGFYDHAAIEEQLGSLQMRDRPLADNARIAESLLRLAVLCEDEGYREEALRTLRVHARVMERPNLFTAPYAIALRRYLTPPAQLTLTGTPGSSQTLREAAQRLPLPLLCIRTRDARETEEAGAAYLCVGSACAAPARDPAALRDAFEMLRG